jgi:hypothetical protein
VHRLNGEHYGDSVRTTVHAFVIAVTAVLLAGAYASAPGLAAQAASIQINLLADRTTQKDTLMKIAAAMPEGRLGYKPTPPVIVMKATSRQSMLQAAAETRFETPETSMDRWSSISG